MLLFALGVFVALQLYGIRSLSRRGPDSPAVVAREAIQADNTIVGLVGGIRRFEPLTPEPPEGGAAERTRFVARVVGARDSGLMTVELARRDGRWVVVDASFTFSNGTRFPVAGSARW